MTQRLHNKAWDHFVSWARSRGLNPVPANPWTVAAFIRACEPNYSLGAIRKMVGSITRVHAEKTRVRLDRHPLIQRTLERIERRAEIKPQTTELFEEADFFATKPSKPKRQPRKVTKPEPPTPGLRSLSATPRLVRRRRLRR